MDTNTVIEGTVKFRDGKKWKSRWCVVRKLSPVADCLHLQLYRDSKERYKQGQTKASLSLEHFLGIQSGFTLDKESNTLAIVCQEVIVVLAFDTREHLMQWQVKISANLGEGDQFLVQISSAPPKAKLLPGPARLLIQEFQFCLTVGVPPRLIAFWQIRQLRRFGVVDGKFCFEGGSRCGRGEGVFVLVSEKPEDLTRTFHLAADGRLFTRKRVVTRNLSVMENPRKHHTYRPDSRLSDVSSLDSVAEGMGHPHPHPAGCEPLKNSCSCSLSREDVMSWTPDTDSNKFDLKSLWSPDTPIGRCTSCMSQLGGSGSMSRSSTLTITPSCSRFPAWTMDRPKSCGSQKMSTSVTCSSVSLSSHSSRGSCCEYQHRHSPADNSCVCASTLLDSSLTPPCRPPKPTHLSFLRLQSSPASSSPAPLSPTHTLSHSTQTCCCSLTPTSSYGNYDVPKPFNVKQRKLKLDLKEPLRPRLQTQLSSEEYYDTPRKLKDSLVWEYGNYDVPPPAQPVISTLSHSLDDYNSRGSRVDAVTVNCTGDKSEISNSSNEEILPFQINKVKLTGEGKMPVMSPCGKIIENVEPSYEEKLDHLLENNALTYLDDSTSNYVNVDASDNNNLQHGSCVSNNDADKICLNNEHNYSNISLVQSLENYENCKYYFSEESKNENVDQVNHSQSEKDSNTSVNCHDGKLPYCSVCGHICSTDDASTGSLPVCNQSEGSELERKNMNDSKDVQSKTTDHSCSELVTSSSSILTSKCISTSCLHDIKMESSLLNKVGINKGNFEKTALSKCSVSAANSPASRRPMRHCSNDQNLETKLQWLSLRKRSNSADSARILHIDDESLVDTVSTDSHGRSHVMSIPSSTDSLCAVEKIEDSNDGEELKSKDVKKCEIKLAPLVISESTQLNEVSPTNESLPTKFSDLNGAKRSSSVPNKFFSNRDSSSSNDSGVSTGSLSLKHYGSEFLDFEMPLTTSMSSKRHHLAMTLHNDDAKQKMIPKRSKSVDPLRDLTFTFEGSAPQAGKSTSAEAEVPVFLLGSKKKDYLNPSKASTLPDSRSTSSGTSDMSDYIETLSFSSFSSMDAPDSYRFGRASAPTMKPRSGQEYQKIDRYMLEQETKQS